MKKFLSFFVLAMMFFTSVAECAEIKILKAERDENDGVNVACTVSDSEDLQYVTMVAKEYTASNDDFDAIVYIDQFKPNIADGKFEYTFNMRTGLDDTKVYLLRIGGTNAENVAQKIIAVTGKTIFVAGDVNSDGYIDEKDASLVIKYICGLREFDESELNAANANGDETVDMLDATEILRLSE
jgi:hypothetical protein